MLSAQSGAVQAAEAFSLFHHPEQVHGKIMLIND